MLQRLRASLAFLASLENIVFLLASLICTTVREMIVAVMKQRAVDCIAASANC